MFNLEIGKYYKFDFEKGEYLYTKILGIHGGSIINDSFIDQRGFYYETNKFYPFMDLNYVKNVEYVSLEYIVKYLPNDHPDIKFYLRQKKIKALLN